MAGAGDSQIIYDWLDNVGTQNQALLFVGASLGFRAELNISVSGQGASTSVGSTLRFLGTFKAFAPLKKAPLMEYQIQSEWSRLSSGWRLNCCSDQDDIRHLVRTFTISEDDAELLVVRKPGGHAPSEKKIALNELRRSAAAEGELLMDPLTAVVFGLTCAADLPTEKNRKLFVLVKSGIKAVQFDASKLDRHIHFDKTEIIFCEWQDKSFSQIAVKDSRLPFSAKLSRA